MPASMLSGSVHGKGRRKRKLFTRVVTALITWYFLWKRTQATDDAPWPPTLEQVLDGCVYYATSPTRWLSDMMEDVGRWSPRRTQAAHGLLALMTLAMAMVVGEAGRKRRIEKERKRPKRRKPKPPPKPEAPGAGWAPAPKPKPDLPDEATLRRNLQQYGANLARAMALKREHGDLTPDQEKLLESKFDELRETIRMTEEILAHVVSVRERAEAEKRAAAEHPQGCPCCVVSGG